MKAFIWIGILLFYMGAFVNSVGLGLLALALIALGWITQRAVSDGANTN